MPGPGKKRMRANQRLKDAQRKLRQVKWTSHDEGRPNAMELLQKIDNSALLVILGMDGRVDTYFAVEPVEAVMFLRTLASGLAGIHHVTEDDLAALVKQDLADAGASFTSPEDAPAKEDTDG